MAGTFVYVGAAWSRRCCGWLRRRWLAAITLACCPVTGLPLLHVEEPEFAGARRVVKGAVDRVPAGVGFVLLLPLLLAIAAAIRLTSPGPALFRQIRIGRDGREFTLLKFRTMYADAEARRAELLSRNERAAGVLFKIRDDPRITPVGRWLRKFSLDELPSWSTC
jgi:lipopolysaccharide/colanic/teichoic acid biosynthesis glycosyltransferase